eukprot:TRINITY_DN805_c1_g1_i2.p2 TRINITY_DN805_c1_g1~~TRINITY_DN805_c1_g1_i2.p2  ORF type:complete len:309 (+),score=54.18 TRINITY_DN805_c1_g1_i2:262-1188(+)
MSQSGQPYLMPDGSSLKTYLQKNGFARDVDSSHRKKRSGGKREKSKAFLSRWQVASGVVSSVRKGKKENPHEPHELEGLSKLGMRKLMRCMSDRMLRDMAGPMTAEQMDSLYQPAPFGDTGYRTAFRRLIEHPGENQVWAKFLDITMDKEIKVLERWEAHVKAEKLPKKQKSTPAQLALSRWSRVSRECRKFLKKAHWQQVWDVESQIIEFMQQTGEEAVMKELDLPYDDYYEKMILVGLAQYHKLRFEYDEELCTVCLTIPSKDEKATSVNVTCCDILEAMEIYRGEGLTPGKLQLFLQENTNGVQS